MRKLVWKLKLVKVKLLTIKMNKKMESKLVGLKLWEVLVLSCGLVELKANAE